MPTGSRNACSVCTRDDVDAIDADLLAGASIRSVAARTGIAKSAVGRHRQNHLPSTSPTATRLEEGDVVVGEVDGTVRAKLLGMVDRADRALQAAETKGSVPQIIAAISEIRRCYELEAKLSGELAQPGGVSVNVMVSAEWAAIRVAMLDALAPYPEARVVVADRLAELEAPR